MIRVTIAASLIAVAVGWGQGTPPPDFSKTPGALQGTWNVLSVNGQKLTSIGQKSTMEFLRDTYSVTTNSRVVERGTFKLDLKTKPTGVDMSIVEGVAAGRTQIGLVQILGDELTLKTNTVGRPLRPTDFKNETWYVLIVATKQK